MRVARGQPPYPPSSHASLEVAGTPATLRLLRSRHRNSVAPGDIIRIMDYLEQVDANPSLRVLVLAASGPAFSAGFHLGGFAEDKEAAARAPTFEAMVDRFEALRIPTICRLQGGVYGGSTDLALTADFRIGVTGMEMFMAAARLGVLPRAGELTCRRRCARGARVREAPGGWEAGRRQLRRRMWLGRQGWAGRRRGGQRGEGGRELLPGGA